ncbi:MAG: CHASE2 domain-containing protein [Alphaproteobacteria bacterium]
MRIGLAGLIAVAMTLLYAVGGFRLADDAIHDLRMRGMDLQASNGLVVVEIDALSLRRLGQWPWPRGHHARVLDQLIEAGADRVAVDISFSSPSDPTQDARLAAAAARAGERLILPVFQQWHHGPDGAPILVVDRPLPQLFGDTALASINVLPDPDGIVRRLPVAGAVDGVVLPFMATALAGSAAAGPDEPYFVDFGLDPGTLPRLSFADVLIGNFDPAAIAGRAVLVGATALELGDVLAVPRWGNLPGSLVIATGYESLVQARAIRPLETSWFVLALCFAAAMAPACQRGATMAPGLVSTAIQLTALAAFAQLLYAGWALKLDLAPVCAGLLLAQGIEIGRHLRAQARRILLQNREAERRQALLRSVVATSIDAVVITDSKGRILLANPACRTVFGHVPEALAGRAATTLVDPQDPIAEPLRAMCRSGQAIPALAYPVDVAGIDCAGRRLALELALSEVAGGGGALDPALADRHFIFVFRDVSGQRALEASRREALHAQVEAERAKTAFLATASHELRTPLNHIRGFASLLAAGVGGALSDRQRSYVGDIDSAAGHLAETIIDILNYAELAGSDAPASAEDVVAAAALVGGAVETLAGLAQARQVRVRIGGDGLEARLRVDAAAMARAVMHVLRNAIQFCPAGGVVVVEVRRRPGGVAIAIADHGPGMEQAAIARLLAPFGKAEEAFARSHGGLGIGLSLARACMERHGGPVDIESLPGMGTTVTLDLPQPEAIAISSAA